MKTFSMNINGMFVRVLGQYYLENRSPGHYKFYRILTMKIGSDDYTMTTWGLIGRHGHSELVKESRRETEERSINKIERGGYSASQDILIDQPSILEERTRVLLERLTRSLSIGNDPTPFWVYQHVPEAKEPSK